MVMESTIHSQLPVNRQWFRMNNFEQERSPLAIRQ
jgi:hypothetical protein